MGKILPRRFNLGTKAKNKKTGWWARGRKDPVDEWKKYSIEVQKAAYGQGKRLQLSAKKVQRKEGRAGNEGGKDDEIV